MANITSFIDVDQFFLGEHLTYNKFTSEISEKANILIDNSIIIKDALNQLFQGAEGGAEQAKIPIPISSAPVGWTRDTSFTLDRALRVTDGATLPPGAGSTATGGASGGSWTISGFGSTAIADHTHDLATHVHNMNHIHTMDSHTHTYAHTHITNSHSHSISSEILTTGLDILGDLAQGKANSTGTLLSSYHTHTLTSHNHGGATSMSNVTETNSQSSSTSGSTSVDTNSSAMDTGIPSPNITGSAGGHQHTISNDGSWRPKYVNTLICKRD